MNLKWIVWFYYENKINKKRDEKLNKNKNKSK